MCHRQLSGPPFSCPQRQPPVPQHGPQEEGRRKGGGREEEVRTTVSVRFKEGGATCVYEDPAMLCAVEDGKE